MATTGMIQTRETRLESSSAWAWMSRAPDFTLLSRRRAHSNSVARIARPSGPRMIGPGPGMGAMAMPARMTTVPAMRMANRHRIERRRLRYSGLVGLTARAWPGERDAVVGLERAAPAPPGRE